MQQSVAGRPDSIAGGHADSPVGRAQTGDSGGPGLNPGLVHLHYLPYVTEHLECDQNKPFIVGKMYIFFTQWGLKRIYCQMCYLYNILMYRYRLLCEEEKSFCAQQFQRNRKCFFHIKHCWM